MPELGTPKRIPFDPASARSSVFQALVEARLEHGGDRVALVDGDERALGYDNILRACFALGSALKSGSEKVNDPSEAISAFPKLSGETVPIMPKNALAQSQL